MKVAVPAMGESGYDENISDHFGRCKTFAIYDTEEEDLSFIPNNSKHMGGKGNPPELLAEENIDLMLCANLGRKAVSLFEELGIDVYCGAGGTIEDALDSWDDDQLREASVSDACEEGRHDH
ncbi:MAG: NifB/NifX family molybdenum-iron cluster-binding protein [Candidatus Thermoplasmatota archaeon]|nr:NifB/NifX family molybdenum-iron cluster-binding protein [Candidatus Thermoplasmatota archaeon]